jgi:arylsulfatase A-like enzyme
VVRAFTESVDVLPTICRWLGIEVPLQADGHALQPFLGGDGLGADGTPDHWRTEAHWSWSFSNPATHQAERYFGVPMAHCSLDVARGDTVKYVQFAADPGVLPPILFDLVDDPGQLRDLVPAGGSAHLGWEAARRRGRPRQLVVTGPGARWEADQPERGSSSPGRSATESIRWVWGALASSERP